MGEAAYPLLIKGLQSQSKIISVGWALLHFSDKYYFYKHLRKCLTCRGAHFLTFWWAKPNRHCSNEDTSTCQLSMKAAHRRESKTVSVQQKQNAQLHL